MPSDTIDYPPIQPDLLDTAAPPPAQRTEIAVASAQAVDIERLDLTTLALAKFGDWRTAVKQAEKVATAVHDLSTATKCKEVRSLRERTINAPIAEARKTEKALKSRLKATSTAVGEELERIETEYTRIDAPFLASIEAAETKIREDAEREKARKAEREQKIATIASWVELAAGKSAADILKGLDYARAFVIDADYWQEYEARARQALQDTVTALQEMHAAQAQREQEAAELARRRAEAEAMARAVEALQGLQQYVNAAGKVGNSAKVRALIEALLAEQVDEARFGALLPAAVMARDGALVTMRGMLVGLEAAEQAAEDQRKAAEVAAAEAAAAAIQKAQETTPPADAGGTPAAVAAGADAAQPAEVVAQAAEPAPYMPPRFGGVDPKFAPGSNPENPMMEPAPAAEEPTIKLGDIIALLAPNGGFMTGAYVRDVLGVPPTKTERGALWFTASQVGQIKAALLKRIGEVL